MAAPCRLSWPQQDTALEHAPTAAHALHCIFACQALPLLREALTAGLISSLPLLTDDQARERAWQGWTWVDHLTPCALEVLVYDLGEYLAPGLFPRPELAAAWQRMAAETFQSWRSRVPQHQEHTDVEKPGNQHTQRGHY